MIVIKEPDTVQRFPTRLSVGVCATANIGGPTMTAFAASDQSN
jgi:hypothetical protein